MMGQKYQKERVFTNGAGVLISGCNRFIITFVIAAERMPGSG
jgi:hypothetical protein